jgi:hypothetical protein
MQHGFAVAWVSSPSAFCQESPESVWEVLPQGAVFAFGMRTAFAGGLARRCAKLGGKKREDACLLQSLNSGFISDHSEAEYLLSCFLSFSFLFFGSPSTT